MISCHGRLLLFTAEADAGEGRKDEEKKKKKKKSPGGADFHRFGSISARKAVEKLSKEAFRKEERAQRGAHRPNGRGW